MRWSYLPLVLAATASLHAEAEQAIPEAVKELADTVGKEFIDPAKHERVTFDLTLRSAWGGSEEARIAGWRDPKTGALFLDDGFAVPNPESRKPAASPLAESRPKDTEAKGEKDDDPFPKMELTALGMGGEARIPHAAWMAASGDAQGAAALLKPVKLPEKSTCLSKWRDERIWFHFAAMVHAFMQGKDEEALAHGRFLESSYLKLTDERFPEACEVLAELRRRRAGGAVIAAEAIPALPPERQVAAWIGRLQEIAVIQDGQPGGVDLAEAPEVQALIRVGEPAIPALLDCFENDTRLTRSVHFWRAHHQSRTVLGVHEAALTAIMSILRTEFYSPGSTGSNVTSGGSNRRARLAAELRAYWEKFGKLTFDERMMAVLCDHQADPEARHEAALNLATPNAQPTYGTTVWTGSFENPGGRNPWIAKFEKPTIHEAMLGALDDEIAGIHATDERRRKAGVTEDDGDLFGDPEKRPVDVPYETRNAVEFFTGVLGELQDPRAGGPLAERAAKATDPAIRSWFADAAHHVGNPAALTELCRLVVAKEFPAPATDDHRAFTALYTALCADPQTKRDGLAAIAKRENPWFPGAVARVVADRSLGSESTAVQFDPWCLTLLEEALQDTRETGFTDLLRKDDDEWELFHREPNGNGNIDDGAPFLDETKYDREWKIRICDRACDALLKFLGDHAQETYLPISKDREAFINDLKTYLSRYRGTFRELSDYLDGGTGFSIEGGRFLPILPPLDRAATGEDVTAGRAVFHLPNPGEKPVMQTPLNAEWFAKESSGFRGDGKFHGRDVIILQVERDADGGLWFGIADGNGFHVVPGKEIGMLHALPDRH
jgi:hypothetical protein